MSLSAVLPILVIILLIIIVYIVRKRKRINDDFVTTNIYLYKREEFPLNVYFYENTQTHAKFAPLYYAFVKAIEYFNKAFDFRFFTMNDNITTYPNIVMVQIACGSHTGCISSFDDVGGVLAHATLPPYRKVCIDCKDIDYDPLYVVIMHELGHIIGLMHTTNQEVASLMNAYINADLRDFTEYDKERVRYMYPFVD